MVPPKDLLTVSKQLERQLFRFSEGMDFLSPFFFFFFLLAYASTQRSSPNPPVVGVGKVVCFPGPQKFQLIGLIEKESVVSGMKSLGLREKSLDPFHAKQRRIPGKPRGISKWETILPPKSQPREGFTSEKKFLLSCK